MAFNPALGAIASSSSITMRFTWRGFSARELVSSFGSCFSLSEFLRMLLTRFLICSAFSSSWVSRPKILSLISSLAILGLNFHLVTLSFAFLVLMHKDNYHHTQDGDLTDNLACLLHSLLFGQFGHLGHLA